MLYLVKLKGMKIVQLKYILIYRGKEPKKKKGKKVKTYNSGYSLVVTHPTTNPPISSLCMAERTGFPILLSLWSYVLDTVLQNHIYSIYTIEDPMLNRKPTLVYYVCILRHRLGAALEFYIKERTCVDKQSKGLRRNAISRYNIFQVLDFILC